MNFEDEPYVRVYVRDTKTWLKLGFEGQAVLLFVLRKLDRAGVLDGIDEPAADVALLTGVPVAIVEAGLPRLLERGVLVLRGDRLIMPNYIEAQSCAKSDRLRQQEQRQRRRNDSLADSSASGAVTIRDDSSRDVTAVTSRHEPSQDVTPILSVPSFSDQGRERARDPARDPAPHEVLEPTRKRSRFAPPDFEPNDKHRMRCAELRFDVGELAGKFKRHEFQRDYSDWDRRFDGWIEDEKLTRAAARAAPSNARASPAGHGGSESVRATGWGRHIPTEIGDYAQKHALDAGAVAGEMLRSGELDRVTSHSEAYRMLAERLKTMVKDRARAKRAGTEAA